MKNENRNSGAGAAPQVMGDSHLDLLFMNLASSERRQLLGLLYERAPDSLPRRDIATYLSQGETTTPTRQDPTEGVRRVLGDLQHIHLPKLEDAGLIDQGTTQDTVAITDHPAFEDTGIIAAICDHADADSDSLDELFAALADSRRRTILNVLSHQFGPIHRETLARELAANEQNISESDVSIETVDRILGSLHHIHLPHLSEAGLIEYEADEQTVAYAGHPDLHVSWMHSLLEPGFRPSLTGESDLKGVGEIEGREQVVSFGQSLCDRADEELFCMFTDTDLLEAGCMTRLRDASRRGVDVYLGTRDPTVREYIQENAPEVILWEPNTDWLNLPVAGGRVGRLLFVDREAVMLGTLLEETTDGVSEEQAIIGEGVTNTLVTILSQLLTPHLEQIDEHSEDIESQLPL